MQSTPLLGNHLLVREWMSSLGILLHADQCMSQEWIPAGFFWCNIWSCGGPRPAKHNNCCRLFQGVSPLFHWEKEVQTKWHSWHISFQCTMEQKLVALFLPSRWSWCGGWTASLWSKANKQMKKSKTCSFIQWKKEMSAMLNGKCPCSFMNVPFAGTTRNSLHETNWTLSQC